MIFHRIFGGKKKSFRSATYHRLVKTTPKPNATKNRRGELVAPEPPEPLSPPPPELVVAVLFAASVGEGAIARKR